MQNKFDELLSKSEEKDSVISFHRSMFKLGDFMAALTEAFQHQGLDEFGKKLADRGGVPTWKENKHLWFNQGIETEILRLNGKGWQKGKVRIKVTLEFCPDEPELNEIPEINELKSPLDDLRQRMHKDN